MLKTVIRSCDGTKTRAVTVANRLRLGSDSRELTAEISLDVMAKSQDDKKAQATKAEPSDSPSASSSSLLTSFFVTAWPLYVSAAILRVVLLLYGLWQDANSPLKYTDIDYLVFTDAARFVWRGGSPYARETYRYTPLLAWMLLPTAWTNSGSSQLDAICFSSGKAMFAVADLLAGWLIERVLTMRGGDTTMDSTRARKFAAIWLLNPMVATISTRGSSEGLLGVLVMALLWAVLSRKVSLAGFLLGFGVHFKIYPFIYAPAIIWWMDEDRFVHLRKVKGKKVRWQAGTAAPSMDLWTAIWHFPTPERIKLAVISLGTFLGLNILMLSL
jgi:phosphatidylinositol glycan class M